MNTCHGIDCSHYQEDEQFRQIIKTAPQFVILKATEGETYTDLTFLKRVAILNENNIPWGLYHFFRTTSSPISQAKHFLQQIQIMFDTYQKIGLQSIAPLLVLDVEKHPKEQKLPDYDEIAQWVKYVYEKTDVLPLIYGSPNPWNEILAVRTGTFDITQCPLWIAHYEVKKPTIPFGWENYTFWQYTNRPYDQDIFQGSKTELDDFWKKHSYKISLSQTSLKNKVLPISDFFTKNQEKIHGALISHHQTDQVFTSLIQSPEVKFIFHRGTLGAAPDIDKKCLARMLAIPYHTELGIWHLFSHQSDIIRQLSHLLSFLRQINQQTKRVPLVAIGLHHERDKLPQYEQFKEFIRRYFSITKTYPLIYANRNVLDILLSNQSAQEQEFFKQCPLLLEHWTNDLYPTLPSLNSGWKEVTFWKKESTQCIFHEKSQEQLHLLLKEHGYDFGSNNIALSF